MAVDSIMRKAACYLRYLFLNKANVHLGKGKIRSFFPNSHFGISPLYGSRIDLVGLGF